MKKILILVSEKPENPESMNWTPFRDAVKQRLPETYIVDIKALPQFVYYADSDYMRVIDLEDKIDPANYDFVIFRKIGDQQELAIAMQHYLRSKNIPFIDTYLPEQGAGKLASSFLRSSVHLPVPATLWAGSDNLQTAINKFNFTYPLILKADKGRKGKDNYLIKNEEHLIDVLKDNQAKIFIVQTYIPNDGDFRVLVTGTKARLIIKRKGVEGSHLNNTSQGGVAVKLELSDINQQILEDSVRAANYEKLAVAGVDIIVDNNTQRHYILEVNRAPQLGTGAYVDEKLDAYVAGIEELLS